MKGQNKKKVNMRDSTEVTHLMIDLFCGFGGTTLGFSKVSGVKVIAAVNHDPKAIKSHWLNHPEVAHFQEDIRTLDLSKLMKVTTVATRQHPSAKLILWASLECTNFSKAKGGKPRDASSRTLATHLYRYCDALHPDFIMIENVEEFQRWGPLDDKGKPLKRKNGTDWLRWRTEICSRGYVDEWKMLNSADFGAYTSRKRLFGVFARSLDQIRWPLPTHTKNTNPGVFGELEKWNSIKHCLDLSDEGNSIFFRKKPLVEYTLNRIYAGLVKYIANGDESFLIKYNSKSANGVCYAPCTPSPAIATQDRLGFVFISKYFSGNPGSKVSSINEPAGAITCIDHHSVIKVNFGENPSIIKPNTQATNTFIYNPEYKGNSWDINRPCFTLIPRMDKSPPYFISASSGSFNSVIHDTDSENLMKIKKLMTHYNITDIKMRMLKVSELLKIQGFPPDYAIEGTQVDQKRFIGNSVETNVVSALGRAMYDKP